MLRLPRYRLTDVLQRNGNNFDLLRLVCSCAVIFGHSFLIVNDPRYPLGTWDPARFLGYEGVYSASIAVKIFFFVSGLLVTNSLIEKKSVLGFGLGRFFRIWPAYGVLLLVSAFVIGPAFSAMEVSEYFSRSSPFTYIWSNWWMVPQDELAGVFFENPLPHMVNGALWSLPYEVSCYLVLLTLFVLGVHRSRVFSAILIGLVLIDPLLPHSLLFPWRDPNPQFAYVPPCFALGAALVLIKNRVTLGWEFVVVPLIAFIALRTTRYGPMAFFISLFSLVLYLSAFSWVRKLRLPFDCSYGTYVWGFVIQQMLVTKFAAKGLPFKLSVALVLSVAVGILSWYVVEKPAIELGRRCVRRLRPEASSYAAQPGELTL